jgi:hypothetical protein
VLTGGWRGWRGVGAATLAGASTRGVRLRFDDSGQPGVLRPRQPSDSRPLPVLTDRATAAGAGTGGLLALTVDGEPVNARVVGTLRRFPTLAADAPGFVVADAATLDGALDASLPGQGATDELWISTSRPGRLHAALGRPPLDRLSAGFRTAVQRSLRADPIARGVLGTLAGLALAGLLTRLVVGAVRAAGAVAVPDPPLVAVAPWAGLALLALAAIGASALVGGAAAWVSKVRR